MMNAPRRFALVVLVMICLGYGLAHGNGKTKSPDHSGKVEESMMSQRIEITGRYGKSVRGRVGGIPVLVLRGTYEEMGEAHGALAGEDIISLLDSVIIPYINRAEPNAWDKKILPISDSSRFPDDYEKEMKGLVTGLRKTHSKDHGSMLKTVNREIDVRDLRALNCLADLIFSSGGCSSFSAWGHLTRNGEVVLGRNLDATRISDGTSFMVMARVPSEHGRKATIEITGPGILGAATCMNSDGVVILGHDSNGLQKPAFAGWVPRALVMREVIESVEAADSAEQIAHMFRDRPVRIGGNAHISRDTEKRPESGRPFVVEWDGSQKDGGIALRIAESSEAESTIVCTNHYLKHQPRAPITESSEVRYNRLSRLLNEARTSGELIGIKKATGMMDSVSKNGSAVTYLSAIAFPKRKKMIFAVSPSGGVSATKGKWIEISWDRIFRLGKN